jgi:hypothetical protein
METALERRWTIGSIAAATTAGGAFDDNDFVAVPVVAVDPGVVARGTGIGAVVRHRLEPVELDSEASFTRMSSLEGGASATKPTRSRSLA